MATAAGGDRARPRVGLGVALLRPDGALLVGTRLGSHGAGQLAFPGGHLEGGESWAACTAREVAEEAGLQLAEARFSLLGVTNDVMPHGLHYVTLFMGARLSDAEAGGVVNGEPHKCAGWEWVQPAALAAVSGGGGGGGCSADDNEAGGAAAEAAAAGGHPPLLPPPVMFTSLRNFLAEGLAAGLATLPLPR